MRSINRLVIEFENGIEVNEDSLRLLYGGNPMMLKNLLGVGIEKLTVSTAGVGSQDTVLFLSSKETFEPETDRTVVRKVHIKTRDEKKIEAVVRFNDVLTMLESAERKDVSGIFSIVCTEEDLNDLRKARDLLGGDTSWVGHHTIHLLAEISLNKEMRGKVMSEWLCFNVDEDVYDNLCVDFLDEGNLTFLITTIDEQGHGSAFAEYLQNTFKNYETD